MTKRQENLKKEFYNNYKYMPTDIFSSPGRIELLGNHTDHNYGKVLVSSVNLDILALTRKRCDNIVTLISHGFDKIVVNLNDLNKVQSEEGKSISLIKGVLSKMKELGYNIGGFDALCDSLIPKGAGVSSSAAFEVLIGQIENYYYNSNNILPFEIAKVAQYSECEYFNKPCGLLDQSGIALGGINYIDFKNPQKPIVENIQVDIPNYQFILINTGGTHENLTCYYAKIKEDMLKVSNFFKKDVLRQIDVKDFFKKEEEIINEFGQDIYNRALHFFEENKRVEIAYHAIKDNDFETLFKQITLSGLSSYYKLKNCYCETEEEPLAKALKYVNSIDNKSYVRVHGGGFAGTILYILPKCDLENNLNKLYSYFGLDNVILVTLNKYGTRHIGEIENED